MLRPIAPLPNGGLHLFKIVHDLNVTCPLGIIALR